MNSAIETEGLTRCFGDKVAVDNLTFRVDPGQVVALLGPNGAGKTTVVRILACLIAASAGRASVLGLNTAVDATRIRGRVGILTERPGLLLRLNALQNLLFFCRLYGVANAAEQAEKHLKLLDLWPRRESPVATFSKGMKQKIAVARALLHEPEVLFFDEPTTGLDVVTARTIRGLISDLRQQGRTILLTTHNLDEAERLADRIVVLDGTLRAEGSPEVLRRRLFVSRLRIGLAAMQPEFAELTRRIAGVRKVETDGTSLAMRLENPDELTPQIVARLVAAGARIRSVTEEKPPLEEIYLKILRSEESTE